MSRCGVMCAVLIGAGLLSLQVAAAPGGPLPEWVRFSDEAKHYTEAHPHSAAGTDRFVSLDIDVSYPNYKIIQRVQRLGNYAEVSRRDGYGQEAIQGPAVQRRILQAFHGFFSIDDEYELSSIRFDQQKNFPRAGFRITTETVVPSAPGGHLTVERRCGFVQAAKADALVSGLPGEMYHYRCDSDIEGSTTAPPVLHFWYSDYLDIVVNRYYDHARKDDLTNMENDRSLTFVDGTGQRRTARYSNFPR